MDTLIFHVKIEILFIGFIKDHPQNIDYNVYLHKIHSMQLLLFIIIYPLLWFISILPFRVLYALSDFTYILVYYIIGYRKETVRENLALTLPHLSDKERKIIERKFFHHFCDGFFEMAKTMTISDREINSRFVFTNLEMYQDLEKKEKSIALLCAHYGSYEWLISINKHILFKGYGIYKKIANKYFDQLVHNIRSKFKAHLIDTKESIQVMTENQKNGVLGVYGFASDQSPKKGKAFHWNNFMGITVPVHTGAEMLAKRMDMNMIFVKVKKIKRGFYEATFVHLTDDVVGVPDYEITDTFLSLVEAQIYEAPEYYLWTHKRWKHAI
jgi:KDO2-lipid IV(A) lauroyltransferase